MRLFFSILLSFASGLMAHADNHLPTAYILRRRSADQRIHGLTFDPLKMLIRFSSAGTENLRPTVDIKGYFKNEGWVLLGPDHSPLGSEFKLPLYLNGKVNDLWLEARGPNGEKEQEHVFIYAPEAQEFHVVSAWNNLLVAFGLGGYGYYQTGFGTYNATTAVLHAKFAPQSDSRWGYSAAAEMTIVTLASNFGGHNAQALQLNADASYRLTPAVLSNWNPQLLLGANYVTMLTNGGPFGFSNLIAPEMGFRSRHYYNSTDAWTGEVRYVALDWRNGFKQLGVNFSLGWSRMLHNSHRLELSLEFENYAFQSNSTTWIRSSTGSFNVGYSL